MTVTANLTRKRLPARPRVNVRESGDPESWHVRALFRTCDLPPAPEGECTGRNGVRCYGYRNVCAYCREVEAWDEQVLNLTAQVTGWSLHESDLSSYSPTGRPFTTRPSVYTHVRHPRVTVVVWSGGLDI
jgi:hypothetical protein